MKTQLIFGAVLAIALCSLTPAHAAPPTYKTYSAGSTNAGTLAYAVIGANSDNAGAPVVTAIDATSDKAGSLVQFYKVLAEEIASFTNSTVTLPVVNTNAFANSGTVLIRHLYTDTYEKRALTTSTGSTNLVLTVAPLEAVAPGDIIYKVVSAGSGALSLKTNSFTVANSGMSCQMTGSAIYSGQKGKPLLLEVDATTTGTINGVTARFE